MSLHLLLRSVDNKAMNFSIQKNFLRLTTKSLVFNFVAFFASKNSNAQFEVRPAIHAISKQQKEELENGKLGCPGAIKELVKNYDKKGGLLGWFSGGMRPEDCTKKPGYDKQLSDSQLENLIHSYPASRISGMSVDSISKCLEAEKNVSQDDKKGIIGDYYWAMNRLTQSSKANIEAIAAIDLTLGKGKDGKNGFPFWTPTDQKAKDWVYASSLLPGTKEHVAALMQCPAQKKAAAKTLEVDGKNYKIPASNRTTSMDEMVTQTQMALANIFRLDQLSEKLPQKEVFQPSYSESPGTTTMDIDRDSTEYKAWSAAREMALASAPWLRGDEGKRILENYNQEANKARAVIRAGKVNEENAVLPTITDLESRHSRDAIAGIIESQLHLNRRKMHEQLNDRAKAAQCLNSEEKSTACALEHAKTTFKEMPEWKVDEAVQPENLEQYISEDGTVNIPNEEQKKLNFVRDYLGDAECRYGYREVKGEMGAIGTDFIINAGITGVTFGFGSAIALSKAAITAGRAATLTRAAINARRAIIGIDALQIGRGAKNAYEKCDQAMAGILTHRPELAEPAGAAACNNADQQAQFVTEMKQCYLAVAMAGVGMVAVVPGHLAIGKSVLTPAQRLESAGFSKSAVNKIVKEMADAPGAPANAWYKLSKPDPNNSVLNTLEVLGPQFAKDIRHAGYVNDLPKMLESLRNFTDNQSFNPNFAAKFITEVLAKHKGDVADGGAVNALMKAFNEAKKLKDATPSLSHAGAMNAYLTSINMSPAERNALVDCIKGLFGA